MGRTKLSPLLGWGRRTECQAALRMGWCCWPGCLLNCCWEQLPTCSGQASWVAALGPMFSHGRGEGWELASSQEQQPASNKAGVAHCLRSQVRKTGALPIPWSDWAAILSE